MLFLARLIFMTRMTPLVSGGGGPSGTDVSFNSANVTFNSANVTFG